MQQFLIKLKSRLLTITRHLPSFSASLLLIITMDSFAQPGHGMFSPFERFARQDSGASMDMHPAIGFLLIHNRNGFYTWCTATLIETDTLMTSKECADLVNRGFGATIQFRAAPDRPEYEIEKAIPQSLLQAGTENELGLLLTREPVKNIRPVAVNKNRSLLQNGATVTLYGFQETADYRTLPTDDTFGGLVSSQVMISSNGCADLHDTPADNTTFCAGSTSGNEIFGDCAEDRGGPVFLESGSLAGILTNSSHCQDSDNLLLSASITEKDNQAFIQTYKGWNGEQPWELVEDDGEQPPGNYNGHCVATIEDSTYTGYFDDDNGNRGCQVFRENTVCLARTFSHIVGTVFAGWTVASGADISRAVSFTGSSDALPCVMVDENYQFHNGRWNTESKQCEIQAGSSFMFCDQPDTLDNANILTSSPARATGVLVSLAREDPGLTFSLREKIMLGVIGGEGLIIGAETMLLIASCCYIYSKGKREVSHITEAASPSPAPTDATAGTYVQEMVTKFGQKLAD